VYYVLDADLNTIYITCFMIVSSALVYASHRTCSITLMTILDTELLLNLSPFLTDNTATNVNMVISVHATHIKGVRGLALFLWTDCMFGMAHSIIIHTTIISSICLHLLIRHGCHRQKDIETLFYYTDVTVSVVYGMSYMFNVNK
jgi:hypothetical protein